MIPKELPLTKFEKKLSQKNGIVEEGVIQHIFEVIAPTHKFAVEFGAGNGVDHTFVRKLIEKGWRGLLIEGGDRLGAELLSNYKDHPKVCAIKSFVTAENIEELFAQGNVPKDFDFLLIDIDGIDYWVWKAITNYRPKVICIEYNASFGADVDFTVDYSPVFDWQKDDYMGASFSLLCKLAKEKGYELIHCTSVGDNLIFVAKEFADKFERLPHVSDYYQIPQYGKYGRAINGKGHPASKRNTTSAQRVLYKMRYYLMALPRKAVVSFGKMKGRQFKP